MTKLLLTIAISLQALLAFPQPHPVKFGKFSAEELKPMTDSTNADAVVLCDYDQVSFEVTPNNGLNIIYEKHVRIKILSKEGYKWADVAIPYYAYHDNETVGRIDALSAFMGADGKTEKHQMKNSSIIDEVAFGSIHIKKFSIPFIKEQCIIEYKYRITSTDYTDLKERYFQWEIPVKWSELRTYVPSFFIYTGAFKNPLPLEIEEKKDYSQYLTASGGATVNGAYTRYAVKNIPAFIEEPLSSPNKDCLSAMFFQVSEIRMPGRTIFIDTWERISELLTEDEQFGKLQVSNELGKITDKLTGGLKDSAEKMFAVYHYVKHTMRWNGHYDRYAVNNFKKPFEEKSGTSGDINLMLIAMFRRAGLRVYPVILSTRTNGKIQMDYPMLKQFNHVIAYVKIDSLQYLLDATEQNVPYDHLPANDINGFGLAINKSDPFWVPLYERKVSKRTINCIFSVGNDGKITVESQLSSSRHFAEADRNALNDADKNTFLKERYFSKIPDVNILSSDMQNVDSTRLPLNINLKFETSHYSIIDQDFIYLKPKLLFALSENPFKTKTRTYPIDYSFLREETFIFNITCPEDYEFSEVPKSVKLTLPENSLQYVFAATVSGNRINMMTKFSINQTEFSPLQYADLKEIYNQIIAKEAEQLVIMKKK